MKERKGKRERWHDWLTCRPSSRTEACMTFELLQLFVRSSIGLDHTRMFTTYLPTYQVSFLPSLSCLDNTLILQSSWSSLQSQTSSTESGGWILRHLRGCFVLILFKEPTFLVGTGSVSLLFLLCDMIQRLVSVLVLPLVQSEAEAVLLARSLAVQRGTAVSEKDSCVLSSRWCHLGQCALVGCIDLCLF